MLCSRGGLAISKREMAIPSRWRASDSRFVPRMHCNLLYLHTLHAERETREKNKVLRCCNRPIETIRILRCGLPPAAAAAAAVAAWAVKGAKRDLDEGGEEGCLRFNSVTYAHTHTQMQPGYGKSSGKSPSWQNPSHSNLSQCHRPRCCCCWCALALMHWVWGVQWATYVEWREGEREMERPAAALVRIRLQHKSEGDGGGKEGTAYLHTFNPLFLTLLDRVPSVVPQ